MDMIANILSSAIFVLSAAIGSDAEPSQHPSPEASEQINNTLTDEQVIQVVRSTNSLLGLSASDRKSGVLVALIDMLQRESPLDADRALRREAWAILARTSERGDEGRTYPTPGHFEALLQALADPTEAMHVRIPIILAFTHIDREYRDRVASVISEIVLNDPSRHIVGCALTAIGSTPEFANAAAIQRIKGLALCPDEVVPQWWQEMTEHDERRRNSPRGPSRQAPGFQYGAAQAWLATKTSPTAEIAVLTGISVEAEEAIANALLFEFGSAERRGSRRSFVGPLVGASDDQIDRVLDLLDRHAVRSLVANPERMRLGANTALLRALRAGGISPIARRRITELLEQYIPWESAPWVLEEYYETCVLPEDDDPNHHAESRLN